MEKESFGKDKLKKYLTENKLTTVSKLEDKYNKMSDRETFEESRKRLDPDGTFADRFKDRLRSGALDESFGTVAGRKKVLSDLLWEDREKRMAKHAKRERLYEYIKEKKLA